MVQAIAAFMEFCYLAQRSQLDEDTLNQMDTAIARFHQEHKIFKETGVRDDFSLPCQHSISHYRHLIQQFGALNGVCSSITESEHKESIKNPYCRSSHNEPLGQMLLTNQRQDKLKAARVNFSACGMLTGPLLTSGLNNEPQADAASEDGEATGGIASMGDVRLAQNPGKFSMTQRCPRILTQFSPRLSQHDRHTRRFP